MESQAQQLPDEFLALIEKTLKEEHFFTSGAAPIIAICKEKFKDFKTVLLEKLKHKKIVYIRHAQSAYNAWRKEKITNWLTNYQNSVDNYDPSITKVGKEQCKALLELLNSIEREKTELILVSPMRRAIQTFMSIKEAKHISECQNVILTPLLTERMDTPADIGTPLSELRKIFPDLCYDFVHKENWWHFQEKAFDMENRFEKDIKKESGSKVKQRIMLLLIWIAFRKENNVLLVAHSNVYDGFIQKLRFFKPNIKNAEMKIFEQEHVIEFVTKFLKG